MFEIKDIADKALQRVEQINRAKQQKRFRAAIISSTLFICTLSTLVIATETETGRPSLFDSDHPTRIIVDPSVPLARPPTELTGLCKECGLEALENHCCCKSDEQCEECSEECNT